MERKARTAQKFAAQYEFHYGAPLRRAFVRRDISSARTPLEQILSNKTSGIGGGRGGRTRLALLLTLLWVNSANDHSSSRRARWWGEMICLDDIERSARVVSANFKTLADRNLITVTPAAPGSSPTVTLLDELGTGQPYNRPDGRAGQSYFRIPETLWTTGLIGELSGPGLAIYLVLLHYHRPDRPGIWLAPDYFHEHHGLSEGTRLAGVADLYEHGVITVQERAIDRKGGGEYRTYPRRILTFDRRFTPPLPAKTQHEERETSPQSNTPAATYHPVDDWAVQP